MKCGPRVGLILASLVLLVGCRGSGQHPSAGVVRDSAGVRIIDLPPAVAGEAVVELSTDPSWNPATGLEIGDLSDLDVVPGLGTLLLDRLAVNVTVLSEAGDVLAGIGRTGQGPGEFDPQGLRRLVATDSSVFVPDLFLQRITEFAFDGEVLNTQAFPFTPLYAVDWRSFPGGGLVFRAYEQLGDQIIRLMGETVDTILSLPISNDYPNILLPPMTLWDVTADGDVLFARSDQGAVELRRSGTGEVVWRTQWAASAEELGDDDVAHLQGLVRQTILRETPQISAEDLAGTLALIHYPERAPVLAGIMAATGGEFWVRRARMVREMGTDALLIGSVEGYGGRNWDVLRSDGLLKARVRLPGGFTPRRFYGEWLYGILADELGIETAARVRASY